MSSGSALRVMLIVLKPPLFFVCLFSSSVCIQYNTQKQKSGKICCFFASVYDTEHNRRTESGGGLGTRVGRPGNEARGGLGMRLGEVLYCAPKWLALLLIRENLLKTRSL